MGLISNRVEKSEIKAGDHIYTYRAVFAYSHHGIYVGGNKVVHFTHFTPGPGEQIQCRICLETDGRDFIAPCKCKGTSKYVHRECLDHWRAVRRFANYYFKIE